MQEVGEDGKVKATVNNSATKAVLERLKAMRWDDNSMGSTFDYAWGTMNQAFAAGQVGHVHRWLRPLHVDDPERQPAAADYGVTIIPLATRRTPASSAAAPSPPSTS